MKPTYENYQHWRSAMTNEAGLTLSADYCKERIEALGNDKDASTRAFVDAYGEDHRRQIIQWFEKALAGA